jgi:hypothetical protein
MVKIKAMKKVIRMIKWEIVEKKTKSLLIAYRKELFKREIYRTKYKQISKDNIRAVFARIILNRTICEFKKNMIFARIQYKIFIKKVKGFIECKQKFQIALEIRNEILNKVFSTVKKGEYEKLFVMNSKKYYNFLLKKKISKTLNSIKRLRNILKGSIFEFRIWHKNQVQIIIARNWLCYYLKKTAISKRINEYIEEEKNKFDEVNNETDKILFPQVTNRFNNNNEEEGAIYAIHQVNGNNNLNNRNNEYQSKILNTNNTSNNNSKNLLGLNDMFSRKISFNNDNMINKQYMQMQRSNNSIPNFDYYGEMKIILFAKIIDLESMVKFIYNKNI